MSERPLDEAMLEISMKMCAAVLVLVVFWTGATMMVKTAIREWKAPVAAEEARGGSTTDR